MNGSTSDQHRNFSGFCLYMTNATLNS